MRRPTMWMRHAYGWYFAALGCFLPYIALYYRSLGLTGLKIGLLTAIPPIAVALMAPAWGMLTDSLGIHRLVLRSALGMAALIALALTQARTFGPILLLVLLLALVSAPIASLLDGYGVTISDRYQRPFGQIRVWGSLGYSIATWLIGWLMGATVSPLFLVGYGVSLLLAFGAAFGLPALTLRSSEPFWHGMAAVIREPAMIVLLVATYIASGSTSIIFNYFGIYLTELGGSAELVGTANALSAISELPVLFFGAWLLTRLGSRRMLIVAMIVYLVRFGLYTILPSPAWVLPLQLSHGLSFGVYLMASVTLAYQLVGPARATTAQGLLTAMTYGFGSITGSFVGGGLLDRIGIMGVFRVATGLMALALVVFVLGSQYTPAFARQHAHSDW